MSQLEPQHWVERYGDRLYAYALRQVRNPELAEDLVQEALLTALEARDSFRGASSEATWLHAILRRKIADHYRRQARESPPATEDGLEAFFDERGHWRREARPSPIEVPGQLLESEEFRDWLDRCLDKLPKRHEQVFRYKMLEEKPAEVICKDLDITPSNYWVIMHRAKLKLRQCMESFL